MKIVVIGCTHAGTAAILNLKKLYNDIDITVYERNDNISFLSCGIALYVAGVVQDPKGLFYSSPEELNKLGVTTKMNNDVFDIDFENKTLKAKNLVNNEIIDDTFDKLIITSGSWPIIPKLEGIDLDNILLSKNFNHSNKIIDKSHDLKKITVVGAGYIGVELAEAFQEKGKDVTLVDAEPRILSRYLDKEFTDLAEEEMKNKGIKLMLGESINGFEGNNGKVSKFSTNSGTYDTDLVILCVGFKPNTELFKDKLDMLPNGAIIIDEYMKTSDPNTFAAGDCCTVKFNPTGKNEYIPLATNAVRMGTLVAKNIKENTIPYIGTQGTSGIKIYDLNIASTGLNEISAKKADINYEISILEDNYRPEFMPEYEKVKLKIIYNKDTKVLLGAQILSKANLTQSINTLSICIQNKVKIDELAFTDFFFQPHYNKPWNYLNSVALNKI
jgi:NADPH-dependent 2,4-dienoyl-CoA reductase/sulfur reductase-like enzyme